MRSKRVLASSEIRVERQTSFCSRRDPKEGLRNCQTARLKARVGMMKEGGVSVKKEKERGRRRAEGEGEGQEGKREEKEERRLSLEKKSLRAE